MTTQVQDYLYLAVPFDRPPLALVPTDQAWTQMIQAARLCAADAAETELRRRYPELEA